MSDSAFALSDHVTRRARLAGGSLIEGRNPFNVPFDELASPGHGGVSSFAHYDYLGLARDPRIASAAMDAIVQFGPSVGASRMVGGERSLHRSFEAELAEFVRHEAAISTVSGYGLNVSLVGHVLGSSDLVVYDHHSHNSVMTGVALTRATGIAFRHNDLDHLEYLLGRYGKNHRRILIAAEGLYSMDGDVADLPRLIDIKERAGAWLMLDEAHSVGSLGATGRGLTEHFGVDPTSVEFLVGTLSKAFVSCGGFVCASEAAVHWLRHTLPAHVYSVGAPPPVVASAREALGILRREPERVGRLRENGRYAIAGARARGLNTGTAGGHCILPILFSSQESAIRATYELLARDIYVPPILQRASSNDAARLRVFVSSTLSRPEIDRLLDAVREVAVLLGEPLADTGNVTPLRAPLRAAS